MLHGELTETVWNRDGSKSVHILFPGHTYFRHIGVEHSVENTGIETAVSVHMYSPPLHGSYAPDLEITPSTVGVNLL